MIDLDDLQQLHQLDRNQLFARAAQLDQRWPTVQAALTSLADTYAPAKLAPLDAARTLLLALPTELHGIGMALARLTPPALSGGLWLWDQHQHVPNIQTPTILLSALSAASPINFNVPEVKPANHATTFVDLAPFISADHHPAHIFLLLLALIERLLPSNQPLLPPQPQPSPALMTCTPAVPVAQNPAKQAALQLYERLPFFWGVDALAGVAADWRLRMLWYAETMAWSASLAEVTRLHVMARLPRYWFNIVTFVHLTAPTTPALSPALADQLARLLTIRRLQTLALAAPASLSLVEAVWYLLEFGEWLALYTAALYNVDPMDRVPLQFLDNAI